MPRRPRFSQLYKCHHVMLRGMNGKSLFMDQCDRSKFCLLLQAACEKHGMRVHAFCFMTNHVHLLLEPQQSLLNEAVHSFAFRYAQYFNRKHKHRGYLYQGRFRSIFVEDGLYLKTLMRYIHRNPIEAGLVQHAHEYLWSSHQAYIGKSEYVWLTTDSVLGCFDSDRLQAVEKLRDFVDQDTDARADIEAILRATRQGAYGSEEFVAKFHLKIDNTKVTATLCLNSVLEALCTQHHLEFKDLVGNGKNSDIVDVRSILALIGKRAEGLSMAAVAKLLGKNEGTISRLATRAEKDPDLALRVESILRLHQI